MFGSMHPSVIFRWQPNYWDKNIKNGGSSNKHKFSWFNLWEKITRFFILWCFPECLWLLNSHILNQKDYVLLNTYVTKRGNSLKAEEKEFLVMIVNKLELIPLFGDSFYVLIALKLMILSLLGKILLQKTTNNYWIA